MRLNFVFTQFVALTCTYAALRSADAVAQKPSSPETAPPYSLSVSVNEVGITFHASDTHDLPVLDLKPEEIDVFDNDNGPGRVISLHHLQDRPLHAAFLIDTSGSVAAQASRSRAEAQEAVQALLLHASDQGAVVAFGRSRRVVQGWTNQKSSLLDKINRMGIAPHDPIDGTSVFDTLFSTCFYEFGKSSGAASANLILLFSDGVDTASSVSMKSAVDTCRENRTMIYAFSSKPTASETTPGPSVLTQLTTQTGGRLFYIDGPNGDIHAAIKAVGSDLRDEYLLMYRPKKVNHDGAFHRIILVGPDRVANIVGTSGYYAPAH